MPRLILIFGFVFFLASVAVAASSPPSAPSGRSASWDDYSILLTRNIFSQSRTAARSSGRPAIPQPRPRRADDPTFVLTGVAIRGDVQIAFFENSKTGEVTQTVAGWPLGGGTVQSVAANSVEFNIGGTTRRINIGENLDGVATALSAPDSAPPSAATTESAGVATTNTTTKSTGSSANDILERMRQRRLNQVKQ